MKMYFIALLPPPEVERKVKSVKLEMRERYHTSNALKLPAHITLQAPFKLPEEEEDHLRMLLSCLAQQTPAIKIVLSGFGCFKQKVLFVKIEDDEHIIELHQKISSALEGIGSFQDKGEIQRFHPHINIASRDLKKEDFKSAWKELRSREFSEIFLADHFCLFKHNGKTWDLHGQFFLKLEISPDKV